MTLWLTYNGRRGSAYTPAESSRVESSRVECHEFCRVKSLDAECSIFVSQTVVVVRDGYYLQGEMGVQKLVLLVKDRVVINESSRCEHRNSVLL